MNPTSIIQMNPSLCTAIGDSLAFPARSPHFYSPAALRSSAGAARRPGRASPPDVREVPAALVAALPRCVQQIQGNPYTFIRGWRPLALGRSGAADKGGARRAPDGTVVGTACQRPRRTGAAKAMALTAVLVFAAVVNLSLWGASRVDQQRRTYQLAQQLRKSEARSHLLVVGNRSVNAFLAMSEARVSSVNAIAASGQSNSKPLRRNKI